MSETAGDHVDSSPTHRPWLFVARLAPIAGAAGSSIALGMNVAANGGPLRWHFVAVWVTSIVVADAVCRRVSAAAIAD